jgi:hypothetical protein
VYAGERSLTRDGGLPGPPQAFNSARFDAFDRWADSQRNDRRGTASMAYLPSDLQTYGGTFDRYGSWTYDPSYGYIWYPTVGADWRPYYNGYWTTVRPYGWTWVGLDVWAWPTHHYGRWGISGNRWFWIPDRRWSPAWVSWADAPGYVSWCPLGFDNRPVFSLTVTSSRLWAGWVVLPRAEFGARDRLVRQYALPPPTVSVRSTLVQGAPPPLPARVAARIDPGRGRTVPRQAPSPPNATNTYSTRRPPAPPFAPGPGVRSRSVERLENPGPNRSSGNTFSPSAPPRMAARPTQAARGEQPAPSRPSVRAAEPQGLRTSRAPSARPPDVSPPRTEAPPPRAQEAPPAAAVRRAVPRQSDERPSGDQQGAPAAGARAAHRR